MHYSALDPILTLLSRQTLQKENMVNKSTAFQSQGDIEEGPPCGVDASNCEDKSDEAEYTHIVIPCPGHKLSEDTGYSNCRREVPIFCAICHGEYNIHDTVSWALNSACTHVYHRRCINRHFLFLISHQAKIQLESFASEHTPPKMECPMCRQDFLEIEWALHQPE